MAEEPVSETDRVRITDLPTLETRPKPNLQKGPTRLEEKMAAKPDDKKAEEQFKQKVRKRDRMKCRCCGREVVITMALVPERAEVHHLYGRLGDFRYADIHAILLCKFDHDRVTGKIGSRVFILQKAADLVHVGEKSLIDARKPVQFKEAA